MNVDYPESIEEAAQVARAALPLASKYNLPANPLNYAVLYEYVTEHNAPLREAFEQLCNTPERMTNENIQALYYKFINQIDVQAFQGVQQEFGKIVSVMQDSLSQVGVESESYQKSLGVAASKLGEADNSKHHAEIVANLIEETSRMHAVSQTLHENLAQSQKDVAELRTEFNRVIKELLIDPLTGIRNRRAFDDDLNKMRVSSIEEGEPLCMLLLDIDYFKKVNDQYGHVIGDAVLKWVANVINQSVRGGDVLARYGGEEFAVILSNTSLAGAKRVAENICEKVRSQKLKKNQLESGAFRVTISIGVALFDGKVASEQLIEWADKALYQAKGTGRNRVCVYQA